jgi:hypothetical protein
MVRPPVAAVALAIALVAAGDSRLSAQPAEEESDEQSFEDDPEAEQPINTEATASTAPRATVIERPPEDVQSFADATLDATPLRFAFNAFGDVSLAGRAPASGEETVDFSLGTFALLINGQLGESLIGTAEVEFDAADDNEQEVTLERLHLRWQTRRFFVIGGRTHTDLGYWNTAFHHGSWLHLPIARPRALRGEDSGGILPIHWVGLESGVVLSGDSGALTVAGGIGNGRGRDETAIALRRDSNDFKALKLKIEYLGLGLPDLRVGVGGLFDRIAAEPADVRPALPDGEIDEYIGNVYTAYRGVRLTLVAEAYGIWHRTAMATSTTTDAFAVLGYRFGRLTPYLQIERTDAHGEPDPYYTPVPDMPSPSTPVDQTELLLGFRVDPSVWSAIKLEYRLTSTDGAGEVGHALALNWSFGI